MAEQKEKRILESPYWVTLLDLLALLGGAVLARVISYPLFHGIVELFCVLVACGIFVIAWNCRVFLGSRYLLFVGMGYLFVGLVDLLHTLSYKGMDVFPQLHADLTLQLWLIGRFIETLSVLVALAVMKRQWKPGVIVGIYAVATVALVAWAFSGTFPRCFIGNAGGEGSLTPFKKISEYAICLILVATMILLRRRRAEFEPLVLRLLIGSMALMILAEVSFTIYTHVEGLANMVGHLFKLAAYYLVYKAMIEMGFTHPAQAIFRHLVKQEENLKSANTELAHRTRELEWSNEELEAFAHTVAHDLQNPLAAIRGNLWILRQELQTGSAESAEGTVEKISATSERMGHLIRDLLDLARVRHGELRREAVDLSRMAGEIAGQLRLRNPARAVHFAIQNGLKAEGDPDLLQVALENLMSNAWKFSVNRDQAQVEVGAREEAGSPVFFVRDNGIGFEQEHAEEIFHAFHRLPTEQEIPGSGIGLASVHRIVERHGGHIWAEGKLGEGATFFFSLQSPPTQPATAATA